MTKTMELATDLLKNVEVVKELVKQQVTEKMVFLRYRDCRLSVL